MPYSDPIKRREYQRDYKSRNKEKRHASVLNYERERYKKLRDDPEFMEKRRVKNARYRAAHREELAEKERDRFRRNLLEKPEETREKMRASDRKHKESHPPTEVDRKRDCLASKKYYLTRKDDQEFKAAALVRAIAWYKEHPERAKANAKKAHRKRMLEDINYKIACRLRGRLNMALRGKGYKQDAVHNLGCSLESLRRHLESLFQYGMTWENWSARGWHIDHIQPLISFDLKDKDQLIAACHWSNLQPLWAEQNISKGGRSPGPDRWPACHQAAVNAVKGVTQ